MKTKPANDSFHNTCILKDCLGLDVQAGDDFRKDSQDRYETDDCGNIREIDGRKVTGGNLTYHLASA